MAHLALSARRTIALTGPDHPVNVIGNAAAITDALRNLIENALLYTPPGTEVIVEIDSIGVISVSDSGPGIAAEDRQRIFERFWRGKGVRTDGAGLGLAIVMEIVKAHGASVTVTDRRPRGALRSPIPNCLKNTGPASRPARPMSQIGTEEMIEWTWQVVGLLGQG
jgi:signal transduction histidine kinase